MYLSSLPKVCWKWWSGIYNHSCFPVTDKADQLHLKKICGKQNHQEWSDLLLTALIKSRFFNSRVWFLIPVKLLNMLCFGHWGVCDSLKKVVNRWLSKNNPANKLIFPGVKTLHYKYLWLNRSTISLKGSSNLLKSFLFFKYKKFKISTAYFILISYPDLTAFFPPDTHCPGSGVYLSYDPSK